MMSWLKPGGGAEAREIYGESLFARRHFGCAELRSLRLGRYKLINAPQPELYDLAKDPDEKHNLYPTQAAMGLALRQKLDRLQASFDSPARKNSRTPDPQSLAALKSLGYVTAQTSESPRSSSIRPDPKQRIREYEALYAAMSLASAGQWSESNRLLEPLRARFPELPALPNGIGLNRQKLGRQAEAAADFRAALKLDPLDAEIHYNLAVSLFALDQLDGATQEAQVALKLAPYYSDAAVLLGNAWMEKKEFSHARGIFQRLLDGSPEDYAANYYLGLLAAKEGEWGEGERFLKTALRVDPESAEAHNLLGSVYHRQLKLEPAARHYREAIRLDPGFARAQYNLGLVFQEKKEQEEAAKQFRRALSSDPNFREAREALRKLESAGR
jgi:tetratricopeptide (TPR) repeat protein